MFKDMPDRTFSLGEVGFVEHYMNKEQRKSSFIIRFIDGSGAISGIYCTTYSWDDMDKIGSIVYGLNRDGDIEFEKLYRADGSPAANISYNHFEGMPFPFVAEFEAADDNVYAVLNRNQKFWLYSDFSVIDEMGTITGYSADFQVNNYDFQRSQTVVSDGVFFEFVYDEKGGLAAIREEFLEEDDFDSFTSDILTLDYHKNGKLRTAEYFFINFVFNQRNRGTWDSSGNIHYDEHGRMTYRSYYVTHGRHYVVYLYEDDDSNRPWAYIELCSMSYSGEEHFGYGNETSVYLFNLK
jgi:hypothetical protein